MQSVSCCQNCEKTFQRDDFNERFPCCMWLIVWKPVEWMVCVCIHIRHEVHLEVALKQPEKLRAALSALCEFKSSQRDFFKFDNNCKWNLWFPKHWSIFRQYFPNRRFYEISTAHTHPSFHWRCLFYLIVSLLNTILSNEGRERSGIECWIWKHE